MIRLINILIIILIFSFNIFSQEKDAELWTAIEIEKKNIIKDFDIAIEQELRFNNNISRLRRYHSDIELKYDAAKWLDLSLNYRLSVNKSIEGISDFRNRYYFDINLEKEYNRFEFDFRNRLQNGYDELYRDDYLNTPENIYRKKIAIAYNIKKSPLEPEIASEFYYKLSGKNRYMYEQYRITAGLQYKINKKNSLEIAYKFQKEINIANPDMQNIISLSYSYEL